ncbi:MAG: hypothetical protein P8020_20830 [Acidobacteriota bacterium]
MFEAYERLPVLLERQRQALAAEDRQELDSLSGEIDALSREITGCPPRFEDLDPESRERLRKLIAKAQAEVDRNMSLWKESLDRVRKAGENLQATRRYFHQFQTTEKSGRRYSKRG